MKIINSIKEIGRKLSNCIESEYYMSKNGERRTQPKSIMDQLANNIYVPIDYYYLKGVISDYQITRLRYLALMEYIASPEEKKERKEELCNYINSELMPIMMAQ